MTPRVSVVITTHQAREYVGEAIASVLAQTFEDFELLVSDDASTDGTDAVVQPFLADPRVSYVRHDPNLGQGGNWGHALQWGVAPIVGVLHADDTWLPGTLAAAVAEFDADGRLDLLSGNWERLRLDGSQVVARSDERWTLSGPAALRRQLIENSCMVSASFVRRDLVARVGLPSTDLRMVVDVEWHRRAEAVARLVTSVPTVFTLYREHEGSTTATSVRSGVFADELAALPERLRPWFERHGLADAVPTARTAMARMLMGQSVVELKERRPARALDLQAKARGLDPASVRTRRAVAARVLARVGRRVPVVLKVLQPGERDDPAGTRAVASTGQATSVDKNSWSRDRSSA